MRSIADPLWPRVYHPVNGAPGWGNVITCRKCEAQEVSPCRSQAVSMRGSDDVVKQFSRKGWKKIEVGRGNCPACSQPKNRSHKMQVAANITSIAPARSALALKALPELYMALGDYYDADKKAYKPGWSDDKIASQLKLAPEFVRDRREKDFGPLAKASPLAEIERALALIDADKLTENLPLNQILPKIGKMNLAIEGLRAAIIKAKELA